jgi:hypothetical protein
MSMAGGLVAFGREPWGAFISQKADGRWVVDINGPVKTSPRLPLYAVCAVCILPVRIGTFLARDIPLDIQSTPARCPSGHAVVIPEYLNLIDNTPGAEPLIMHVFRPASERVSGGEWFTNAQMQKLLIAAREAEKGRPALLATLIDNAPEPVRKLKREKMTRGDWIALGSLVVALIALIVQTNQSPEQISNDELSQLLVQVQVNVQSPESPSTTRETPAESERAHSETQHFLDHSGER